MRIIAGSLGGRQFASSRGHRTHPMSDKVRGALFNVLGNLGGLTVLDAFAGSGALAFEAVSRGAARAVTIDSDRSAQRAIANNVASLDLAGKVKLVRASAGAWLSTTDELFDVVLCDPPYEDLQLSLIARLARRAKPGGLVVLSLPPTAEPEIGAAFKHLVTKNYGDARLSFYRRSS
jgi:16S rRNA (guanine966-N2)-methyltransferase